MLPSEAPLDAPMPQWMETDVPCTNPRAGPCIKKLTQAPCFKATCEMPAPQDDGGQTACAFISCERHRKGIFPSCACMQMMSVLAKLIVQVRILADTRMLALSFQHVTRSNFNLPV